MFLRLHIDLSERNDKIYVNEWNKIISDKSWYANEKNQTISKTNFSKCLYNKEKVLGYSYYTLVQTFCKLFDQAYKNVQTNLMFFDSEILRFYREQ